MKSTNSKKKIIESSYIPVIDENLQAFDLDRALYLGFRAILAYN